MNEVVFLLEEESARVLLEKLFPILAPPDGRTTARFMVFEGKQDLEKQLPKKIHGYLNPNARFILSRVGGLLPR
jgi:hypothetical protein